MRRQSNLATVTHNGRDITFRNDGLFHVETLGRFDTMMKAQNAIDAAVDAEKKMEKVKLELPVVSEAGTRHKITGINSKTGNITLSPPLKKFDEDMGRGRYGSRLTPLIYADVDGVFDDVQRMVVIEQELSEIKRRLELRQLRDRTYRVTTANDIKSAIGDVVAEHKERSKAKLRD